MELGILQAFYLSLAAVAGAILKSVVDWLLARGDKRQSREEAIRQANDTLEEKMRKELREDREADRARLRQAEERILFLVGQVDEMRKTNNALREENLKLVNQSGAESFRLNQQAQTIASQALMISGLQNDLAEAKKRIASLEAVLRKAGVGLPDTGPLASPGEP